jgi:hypothetical protein
MIEETDADLKNSSICTDRDPVERSSPIKEAKNFKKAITGFIGIPIKNHPFHGKDGRYDGDL